MSKSVGDVEINDVILEKLRLYAQCSFSREFWETLTHEEQADLLRNQVVHQFRAWVLGEKVENRELDVHFKYPKTWWQMFKQQHFPKWLLKHFPTQWQETKKKVVFTKTACYPQLPYVFPKGVGNIRFVTTLDTFGRFDFEEGENDE